MDAQYDPNVTFYEEQRLEQPWLRLAAFASALTTPIILVIVFWVLYNNPQMKRSLAIFVPVAAVVVVVDFGVLWLVSAARMVTEVRFEGITVSARPFKRLRRTIPFDRIASCEARDYSPIREYGGWGIRLGPGGKAYNMSGNRGAQLVLASGERVLIGSQKADELAAEIKSRIPRAS
jgi:hypothetical protein